ncbi:MAG: class I SAM-dependent methyltransferase [Oscillospiraceae bacterium]|nr:class I SAM-dependent methyltransferase [Oscillospiraceae bacterium]
MIDDYAAHAAVWDWDGFDNTPEYERWLHCARPYGNKVLLPMCALGQLGAFMAQKGCLVTGFDITQEMITEGLFRFGAIENLDLQIADVRSFSLLTKDFDFCLIKDNDLHLLADLEAVQQALRTIALHMRSGGGLMLALTLPGKKSYKTPLETYHPRVPKESGPKVWKTGQCRYEASSKRFYIKQTVHVDDTQFPYEITLQYYSRRELLRTLRDCGWTVQSETQENGWILECVKN